MVVVKLIHALASGNRLAAELMRLVSFCGIMLALFTPNLANAEISGEVELKSDDRFRGRSLSAGEPVIDADISVDTASGIYAGGSATFTLANQDRIGFQRLDSYLGFAARISENVTVDVGVAGYIFTKRYSGNANDQYAEIYAGLNSGGFAAYLHYTPNYFDRSVPVLYADLNFARSIGSDFTIKAHAGLLAQTSGPPRLGGRLTRYDTRLALSRPILGLEAEIAWTYAGRNDLYFDGPWAGNSALVFSIAKHF